ncbi:MAG: ATP-binding protein [Deltaproteobacteria bacterium]|nr:ATP-binding protein [Deltaproteobacteria bacterium]
MIFVSGPRQVGKTTLFTQLSKSLPGSIYNWDRLPDRRRITAEPDSLFEGDSVYFDEIHKFPRWKNFLKGGFDAHGDHCKIHVTGSARLDVYRRGGDSLLGRYIKYTMHPFTAGEILGVNRKPLEPLELDAVLREAKPGSSELIETWKLLERFGGFPEPFTKANDRHYNQWLQNRHERLVREDIRDMTRIRELSLFESMVALLPSKIGSPLSLNSLKEDLSVSHDSIRLWLSLLEEFYYLFGLPCHSEKVARSLKKERKIYLWDWSEIDDPAIRFENMVACHLNKFVDYMTDSGLAKCSLRYFRDKERNEVDFIVLKNRNPWFMVEAKLNDRSIQKALLSGSKKHGSPPCIQLVNDFGTSSHRKIDGMDYYVMPAAIFFRELI